ncbi:MAG: hypothetical protein NT056_06225 [Proteobacteria bacterium]|nr:hypothetical protein [Pseudomonadota bacterium]
MTQFQAVSPKVEVNGAAVLSVVEGMDTFKKTALDILARHGINNPKKERWYLQQSFLDAFREIAEKIGPVTLKRIGSKIPQTATWPPKIKTVEEALASIDVAYHINHRGGEIGRYRFEKTGKSSGLILCDNPYPCPFDFGLIQATARSFAGKDIIPMVRHDDHQPCRQKGGESCTYLISW